MSLVKLAKHFFKDVNEKDKISARTALLAGPGMAAVSLSNFIHSKKKAGALLFPGLALVGAGIQSHRLEKRK